jgi:hypothetical protein
VLQEKVAQFQNEIFNDSSRPVWNMHIFEKYINETGTTCCAVVLRIHHSMGDGFTLLRVMLKGCKPS